MVKKKNNKNNSPQWLKEHWEKSKNQELITVSIYDYDFQRYVDENILSESVKAGINNYNGSEDKRNFLEKVYYYDDFGTKKVFPYLIQEMQQYKVEDRHQRTSRFFNILTDLKTIELLNRFFLDIGKPKLIPNEITTIIDQIPDDLYEIKQTLIKSLPSCKKQTEPEKLESKQEQEKKEGKTDRAKKARELFNKLNNKECSLEPIEIDFSNLKWDTPDQTYSELFNLDKLIQLIENEQDIESQIDQISWIMHQTFQYWDEIKNLEKSKKIPSDEASERTLCLDVLLGSLTIEKLFLEQMKNIPIAPKIIKSFRHFNYNIDQIINHSNTLKTLTEKYVYIMWAKKELLMELGEEDEISNFNKVSKLLQVLEKTNEIQKYLVIKEKEDNKSKIPVVTESKSHTDEEIDNQRNTVPTKKEIIFKLFDESISDTSDSFKKWRIKIQNKCRTKDKKDNVGVYVGLYMKDRKLELGDIQKGGMIWFKNKKYSRTGLKLKK